MKFCFYAQKQNRRRYKALCMILLLAALLPACALSEEVETALVDLRPLTEAAQEIGVDFDASSFLERVISGDYTEFLSELPSKLEGLFRNETRSLRDSLLLMLLPSILGALLSIFLPQGKASARGAIPLFCAIGLLSCYSKAQAEVYALLEKSETLFHAFTPILASLLSFSGGRGALFVSPMSALFSGFIGSVMRKLVLPLCALGMMLAVANTTGGLLLKRLRKFCHAAAKKLLSATVGIYFALLSCGSALTAAYDGNLMKTAKRLTGLIPVIGSEIGKTLEGIAAGAQLVRGAVGLAGLSCMLSLFAVPCVKLICMGLALRVGAGVCEACGAEENAQLLDSFGDGFFLFFGVLSSVVAGLFLLITATVFLGMQM